jgi:hypothetical protein
MKSLMISKILIVVISILLFFKGSAESKENQNGIQRRVINNFYIGWSSVDITPDQPVINCRGDLTTGVMDPVTSTALAMESGKELPSEKVIMISCDLVGIPDGGESTDNLRDKVRNIIKKSVPEITPDQIILFATHTHMAPDVTESSIEKRWGIDLDAMSSKDYMDFISERIASAAIRAWKNRESGGISYGLGHAVVGHNRLTAFHSGKSEMLSSLNSPEFSHIEGYEDHSVNLLYTWDKNRKLTGIIINIACPSQVMRGDKISADFWHETREELAQRLGKDVFILPQLSAAGDQCPEKRVGAKAEDRMQKMIFPDIESSGIRQRKDIAIRISDAVESVLPYMKNIIEWNPVFVHNMEIVELSKRNVSMDDVNEALKNWPHNPQNLKTENFEKQYEQLLLEIKKNPEIKKEIYRNISRIYEMIKRAHSLKERYEVQKLQPKYPVEVHAIRISDIVITTNPFELYLDYGIRIKARSPAIQTFIVQLAGSGTYLPTFRSIEGGAYGAVPASNIVGHKGGQELVESTLGIINTLWQGK